MHLHRSALLLVLGALLAACGGATPSSGTPCETGRSVPCACVGGGEGAQECSPAGTYGACVCPSRDASADAVEEARPLDAPGEVGGEDVGQLDAPPDAPGLEVAADASSSADGDGSALDAPGEVGVDVQPDAPGDAPADVARPFDAPPGEACYGACATDMDCVRACFVTGEQHRLCCYRHRCEGRDVSQECPGTGDPPAGAALCGAPVCRTDEDCAPCVTGAARWRCNVPDAGALALGLCARL